MPRKPLIEAGSLLPPASGGDTMSRILERDRAKSGRQPPSPRPEGEAGTVPDATPNITSNITAHITDNIKSNEYAKPPAKLAAQSASRASARRDVQQVRASAKEHAKRLASTPAMPITLRLPTGLNDFLDDYAHEHRKAGVKKQDLVARAVQLLVIELTAEAEEEGS